MTKLVILALGLFLLTSPSSASIFNDFFENVSKFFYNVYNLPTGLTNFVIDDLKFSAQELRDTYVSDGSEFDFIVVGGGSAGSVIASRLSEENAKVLLIEAGGSESMFFGIPMGMTYLPLVKDIVWDMKTEPSTEYCLGMINNSCSWVQGKVLGGTSVINGLLATRGNPADYDNWASMGNDGWSYDDVLEYFIRLENNTASDYPNYDPTYRGADGPMPVNFINHKSKMADAFLNAGMEHGFSLVDYNGKNQIGFSRMQTNTKNGERYSANRAYLHPANHRYNLKVTKNSLVKRIDINPETKKVIGVTYEKDGVSISVRANKEVILSAGALHTPQLLMLSGIGPADHLSEMNINVIHDAPGVGKNLMDHVTFLGGSYLIDNGDNPVQVDLLKPWNTYLSEYMTDRTGPLTAPAGIEAVAFMNIDDLESKEGPSNVEMLYGDVNVMTGDHLYYQIVGMKPEVYNMTYGPYVDQRGFQIFPVLTKPKSRGEILLRSDNIKDDPRLIANYFKNSDDMTQLIRAVREMHDLTKTSAMQKYGVKLVPQPIHGCEHLTQDGEAYWECALRTLTYSLWHFSGTTKMGPESDPMSVVDNQLKVYGIEGLRVVDASIMPEVPSGHTNIPTMMIAEKASDMIKKDWDLFHPFRSYMFPSIVPEPPKVQNAKVINDQQPVVASKPQEPVAPTEPLP